jgi:hypothetical protein
MVRIIVTIRLMSTITVRIRDRAMTRVRFRDIIRAMIG